MGWFKKVRSRRKAKRKTRRKKIGRWLKKRKNKGLFKGKLKRFVHKRHKRRIRLIKKIGRGIKKGFKKAAKFVKRSIGASLLLPLLPFKRPMKKQLQKKGISTSGMKFRTLVSTFHKQIVKQGKNYDGDNYEMENDVAFRTPISNELENEDHAIGTAIAGIVSGVISFFRGLKKRKQKAEADNINPADIMTPIELEMAKDTELIEEALVDNSKRSGSVAYKENKKMKKYVKYGIIAVVAVLVLFLVIKKN